MGRLRKLEPEREVGGRRDASGERAAVVFAAETGCHHMPQIRVIPAALHVDQSREQRLQVALVGLYELLMVIIRGAQPPTVAPGPHVDTRVAVITEFALVSAGVQ